LHKSYEEHVQNLERNEPNKIEHNDYNDNKKDWKTIKNWVINSLNEHLFGCSLLFSLLFS